jgi:tetratricopeptide (TPR) repeat protein
MRRWLPGLRPIWLALLLSLSFDPASVAQTRSDLDALNKQIVRLQHAGNYEEAIRLARQALVLAEQLTGAQSVQTTAELVRLGQLFQETGQFAVAEECFAKALAIAEKALGADDIGVAVVIGNLAQLLHHTGRYAEAEPLMRRSLAILQRSAANDHLVATTLNNLGQVLQALNKFDEAIALQQQALVIDDRLFGPIHPSVARDLHNLAGRRRRD